MSLASYFKVERLHSGSRFVCQAAKPYVGIKDKVP